MTINNIIKYAQSGALRSLAIKNDTDTLITYLNLAVIDLYKRFQLDTDEAIYKLLDSTSPNYIDDNTYRLPSNCMYPLAAYQEVGDSGGKELQEIPINDETSKLSIFTVSYDKIQIPVVSAGAYISVIYISNPEPILPGDLDAEVRIPVQLLEPLLHYIAYLAYEAIDGKLQSENGSHYVRYQNSCDRIEKLGLISTTSLNSTTKFVDRGLV